MNQSMNPQLKTQSSAVRYQDYLVTPKIAKEWLTFSEQDEEFRNRKLDEARVNQYASDMKAGRWQSETGENIKFAPDGVLIDGQHRLHAIIKSNSSIVLTIAKNVEKSKATVLDTGKQRSIGDAMMIRKIACPNEHAAGIKQYYQFTRGGHKDNYMALSNDLAIQMYFDEEEFWKETHSEQVRFYREIGRKLNPSFIYGAIAYLRKKSKHKDKITPFFTEICVDGEVKNGTVKNFRKIIDKNYVDKKSSLSKAYLTAYFTKSWNAYVEDKNKNLQYDPAIEGIVDMTTCK